jgi:hypothetical protein
MTFHLVRPFAAQKISGIMMRHGLTRSYQFTYTTKDGHTLQFGHNFCGTAAPSSRVTLVQREHTIRATTATGLTTTSAPRLLRAKSFELVKPEKFATDSSAYAILSHTWRMEKDEITLKDISPEAQQNSMARKAFTKIRLTCDQATRDGLEYVWIDTCCIDKSGSADLSHAINSMYAWYAFAKVCYVYLSDVELAGGQEAFRRSRWFTRAWTLQELCAPTELRFYDMD